MEDAPNEAPGAEIEGQASIQIQVTEMKTLLPPLVIPSSFVLRDFDSLSSSVLTDLGAIFRVRAQE